MGAHQGTRPKVLGGLGSGRKSTRRWPRRDDEGSQHHPAGWHDLQSPHGPVAEPERFEGINTQERYRALRCLDNLDAIEAWRATLDEAKKRKLNHVGAIWAHWRRRQQDSSRSAPAVRNFVKATMPSHKNGARPVYWQHEIDSLIHGHEEPGALRWRRARRVDAPGGLCAGAPLLQCLTRIARHHIGLGCELDPCSGQG
jgi:hypothetical protein